MNIYADMQNGGLQRLIRSRGRYAATVLLAILLPSLATAEAVLEHVDGLPSTFFNPAMSGDGEWMVWKAATSPPVIGMQNLDTGVQTLLDLHTTTGDTGLKFRSGGYLSVNHDGSRVVVGTADDGFSVPNIVLVTDASGTEIARLTVLAENGAPVGLSLQRIKMDKSGRYVVFSVGKGFGGDSTLISLTAAGGGASLTTDEFTRDVFRFDTTNGAIDLVSIDYNNLETDNHTETYGVSAGGRYVLFYSIASNLEAANGVTQAYVRDMTKTGIDAVEHVSVDPDGLAYTFFGIPYMSEDGSRVLMYRRVNDPEGLGNHLLLTFLWERGEGTRALPEFVNSDFYGRHLSGDGRWAVGGHEAFSRLNIDTGSINTYTGADENDQTLIDKPIQSSNGELLLFKNTSLTRPPGEDGIWWTLRYQPDTTPPQWPSAELTIVEVDTLKAGLSWNVAEDDGSGLKEYVVYRDDFEVVRGSAQNYLDEVLSPGTYAYRVEAVDNAGNESTDGPTESIELNYPPPEFATIGVPLHGFSPGYNGTIDHREWPELESFQSGATYPDGSNYGWLEFPFGHIILMHDTERLELLLNITADNQDDAQVDSGDDQFWLLFDVDRDGKITAGVDRRYLLEPGTGNLRSQTFVEPSASEQFNPMRETMSARAEGFGCFTEDETLYEDKNTVQGTICRRHRVWEVGIDLREIGIDDSDPVARMGIQIISGAPAIQYALPVNTFNLASYTELILRDIEPGDLTPETRPAQATVVLNVSQGIEDKTGKEDIPFVAGRRTAARANILTSDSSEPGARVAVFARSNGIDAPGSPFIGEEDSIFVNSEGLFDIEVEDRRGWVRLPEFASTAGALEVRAGLYVDGFNPQAQKSITMLPEQELEYWVYGISGGPGSIAAPSEERIYRGIKNNLKYLPTSSLSWVYKGELVTTVNNGPALNAQLQRLYDLMSVVWAQGSGTEPFTKPDMIVGFTGFGLCRSEPASNAECENTEVGKSYPTWRNDTGRVFWGIDTGNTFAHEINHNVDRTSDGTWGRHIPNFKDCGNGGAKTDPQWPYPSTKIEAWAHSIEEYSIYSKGFNRDDLMAYCDLRWSSPYRWRSLFYNYFAAPEVEPPASLTFNAQSQFMNQSITGAVVKTESDVTVDTIYVNGEVNVDGTGELGALLLQPGVPEPPLGIGDYALVQLGCAGETLDSQSFAAFFEGVEGGALERDAFRFTLPMHPDLCGVELRHNGEVLAEITQSLNSPVVEILTPADGDVWDGVQTIVWEGFDNDGDALSYSLFYSHDDGTSWTALTGDLLATEYEVNTDGWIGGESGRIRVIASDGFNNSTTDSPDAFTVLANPPIALITFPAAGDYFPPGVVVEVTSIGYEVGGKRLHGEALRWYLDGVLIGIGESTGLVLPESQFSLVLEVVNPDGLMGTDSTKLKPGTLFANGFE